MTNLLHITVLIFHLYPLLSHSGLFKDYLQYFFALIIQEEIANKFLRIMLSQIGYGVLAEDTIVDLVNYHRKLLETYIHDDEIQTFIDLLRITRQHKFFTYIGDLCMCQGVAIPIAQITLCSVVLNESNADVLMTIT